MAEGFITKDSGKREDYASGMRRDTQENKPRFGLLRPRTIPYAAQFLTRCAELMMRGAEKYGERNWELADSREELERFKESAERHMNQWLAGETDEDHAAAVFFNINAAETTKYRIEHERPNPFAIEGLSISITGPLEGVTYHHHMLDGGSVKDFAGPEGEWHKDLPPHRHSGTALVAHDPSRLVGIDNHTHEPQSCGCSAQGPCFTHR